MYSVSLAGNRLTEKILNVRVCLYNNFTTVLWTFCLERWSLFPIFSYLKYVSWEITLHFLLRSDSDSFSCSPLLSLLCQTCSHLSRKRTGLFFLTISSRKKWTYKIKLLSILFLSAFIYTKSSLSLSQTHTTFSLLSLLYFQGPDGDFSPKILK